MGGADALNATFKSAGVADGGTYTVFIADDGRESKDTLPQSSGWKGVRGAARVGVDDEMWDDAVVIALLRFACGPCSRLLVIKAGTEEEGIKSPPGELRGGGGVEGEALLDALRMLVLNLYAGGGGKGRGREGNVRVQPNLQRFPKAFAIVESADDVVTCTTLLQKAEERVAAILAKHQCASQKRSVTLSPEGTAYVHLSLWRGPAHAQVKSLLLALLAQQVPICLFSKVGEYVHDFVTNPGFFASRR